MVKNKKMSKSSIAVIVLALLLVLSMVMGITGAWFSNTATNGGTVKQFTFGDIKGTISVGMAHYRADQIQDGALKDDAEALADDEEVVADDWIATTVSVANTGDQPFFYAVKVVKEANADLYYVDTTNKLLVKFNALNEYAHLNSLQQANAGGNDDEVEIVMMTHILSTANYNAEYLEGNSVDTVTANGAVKLSSTLADGSTYTLIMVQANNMTQQTALAEIAHVASVTLA